MEFIDGVKKKEIVDIRDMAGGAREGQTVRMNGAVHTIRDVGEVAFVILRKAQGPSLIDIRRCRRSSLCTPGCGA